jgi:DNA-binding LytR/AlgR family response regulator
MFLKECAMNRRIAVCDDEKNMLRQISSYLDQMQAETGDRFEVFYYTSAEDILSHMDRRADYVLLDISMGGMTGMDCAKALREEGFEGELIFITSMENYALEGYGVHAFAFLTKPLVYTELKKQLTECFAKKDKSRLPVLAVDTQAGTQILKINEILYAEVYQHSTCFALTKGRKAEAAVQLSWAEERLLPYGFFRCHRSYLVNMKHIAKIDAAELTLSDGSTVPLSKHRNKEFLSAYTRFMGVELG